MMIDSKHLSVAATFGKLGIELSNLTREEKELAKAELECIHQLIDAIAPNNMNHRIYGITLQEIAFVQKNAQLSGIDKVVVFPVPPHISKNGSLIKSYGSDTTEFMKRINVTPLMESIISKNHDLIVESENKFGVVIYEREE